MGKEPPRPVPFLAHILSLISSEGSLDIQWISATGLGAANTFWMNGPDAWLYGWAVKFFAFE
jgi:hypothetical protein